MEEPLKGKAWILSPPWLVLRRSNVGNNFPNRIITENKTICVSSVKSLTSLSNPLHEAMTKIISEGVKRCAVKVLDERLLSKVFSGDLVASEVKYHAKCLVALYNAAE